MLLRKKSGRSPTTRLFRVTVDARDFTLESEAEFDRVRRACVVAVRRGGDLVRFRFPRGLWRDVLVSPGISLSFTQWEPSVEVEPTAEESAAELSAFYYLEHAG
jgi:hypothetical protein